MIRVARIASGVVLLDVLYGGLVTGSDHDVLVSDVIVV